MKKLLSGATAAVAVMLCMCDSNVSGAEELDISAKAAVLISEDTGEVVYSRNASEKLPMASTTKIMTALLCIESGGLYDEFTVDSQSIRVDARAILLQSTLCAVVCFCLLVMMLPMQQL